MNRQLEQGRWEHGLNSQRRPLCFLGHPEEIQRPSSFPFVGITVRAGGRMNCARLYYRLGWTAIIFWNSDVYFAEQTLTFDGMIELIRERFPAKFYLQARIEREYVD